MFQDKNLKNIGIEVIRKVEDENVIAIVDKVATKIKNTFYDNNINYLDIYKTLLDTPMYYATIPNGLSEANYNYENSTIYFSENIDIENLNEFVYHECIHKLQERKDKKGNLTRLGICEVNELSVKATALNEGAIQYITSKILNKHVKSANIYNITIPTKTEYYPILTNIISQIAYLLGENILIDSVINGNEDFKIEIIDNLGEGEYNAIEKNTNEILKTKNIISELQKEEATQEICTKISANIEQIRQLYFETQNLIFTAYFNNILKRVENEEEINVLKNKLYLYGNLIGTAMDYSYYDNYKLEFDQKCRTKLQEMKNRTPLLVIRDNIIFRIIRKIKMLFTNSRNEYYK